MSARTNKKRPAKNLNGFTDGEMGSHGVEISQSKWGRSEQAQIDVHIGDIVDDLVKWIEGKENEPVAGMFLGCVAWLTNATVLDALAQSKHGVSIVVQKEDFLRPDSEPESGIAGYSRDWKQRLRDQYDALKSPAVPEWFMDTAIGTMEHMNDEEWHALDTAVRCAGFASPKEDRQHRPNMHHKFLVFARAKYLNPEELATEIAKDKAKKFEDDPDAKERTPSDDKWATWYFSMPKMLPVDVWTGSFNMSANATRSRENAVVISCPTVADMYYQEWAEMLTISEPLDWTHTYVTPTFLVGT